MARSGSFMGGVFMALALTRGVLAGTHDASVARPADTFAAFQRGLALDAWNFSVEFPGTYPIGNDPLLLPVAPGGYAPWRAAGATDAFLNAFPSNIVEPTMDVVTLVREGLHSFLEDGLLLIGDSTTRYMYDVLCMELVREVAGDMTDAKLSETLEGINQRGWASEKAKGASQCTWTGGRHGDVSWPLWFKAVVSVNGTIRAVDRSGTSGLGADAKRIYVGLPALHSLHRNGVSRGKGESVCSWDSLSSFKDSVDELVQSIARRQQDREEGSPAQIVVSSGECLCLGKNKSLTEAALAFRELVERAPGEGYKACRGHDYTAWLFDDEGVQSFNDVALGFMAKGAKNVPVVDFYHLLKGDRLCSFSSDGIHGFAPILLTEIALVWSAFFHLEA